MSAAAKLEAACEPLHVTLLELVVAIGDVAETEDEVVETVIRMLESGQVQLSGNFHGAPIGTFS